MSEMQVVVFSLNGQLFGAEALQVFQIIKYQEATKVPRMPKFIEGILNYRDTVLPVINLEKRFDMGESEITKKSKIIITKIEDKLAGFIVSDITEIEKFADKDIEPAPLMIDSNAGAYLKYVGKRDGKLISIINLEKILNESEIKRLSVKIPKT